MLGGVDEEESADIAEWASFGLIFALAAFSFADARPRGLSDQDFVVDDEFTVDDFRVPTLRQWRVAILI